MNTAMPVGVEDFAEIRGNYYWVDKTAVISAFLQDHKKVTLFTRPRRFGKTLMMSMLRYFFDIEGAEEHRRLFAGLEVAQDAEAMAQQGTRPVLFLTLKGWNGLSWDVMQVRVRERLGALFNAYDFLLDDELSAWEQDNFQAVLRNTLPFASLSSSLSFLMQLLEKHYGRKVVLLLDEYDVPIQSAWEHGYYDEAIDFFRDFFSSSLKTNSALDFAVLTGVLRIAKESIFSSLNNLKVDSVLQLKYPEAFGFTQTEVERMARDFGREDKLPEIRQWYDGYRFASHEIYNPWSVVNYFDNGCKPRTYWVNTSGNAILGEMLRHSRSRVMDKLAQVLQGGSLISRVREGFIYSEIYKNEAALYTMLVTTGYLTTKSVTETDLGMQVELILPNRELRSLYRIEILERYHSDEMDMEVDELMRAFIEDDIETVRVGLGQYLEVLTSSFDTAKGKESFYHGLVLGLVATLLDEYIIRSNRESGYGRYDIAVFPKQIGKCGMLIECKVAESEEALAAQAQAALHQIETRDYEAEFRARGVGQVLHYGIAFCGKRVCVLLK
ncbi:MAG: AAA family ATPase [Selenomonas sp.]|nr:AAA family ATPase [Selenomonas sp.]